jgi:HEPN domain-containing protein
MTSEEKVEHWVNISDYDLDTAEVMLNTGRYLYVGFMCHQVIEKIFKAVYLKRKQDTPPYTHKLIYLAQHGNFYDLLSEEQISFILEVEPLNIAARYPQYKERIARRLTPDYCKILMEQTKILQQWAKEQI